MSANCLRSQHNIRTRLAIAVRPQLKQKCEHVVHTIVHGGDVHVAYMQSVGIAGLKQTFLQTRVVGQD